MKKWIFLLLPLTLMAHERVTPKQGVARNKTRSVQERRKENKNRGNQALKQLREKKSQKKNAKR